ncbi:glutamyl-tRNA reductase [Moraxella sp. ZJ142]|uniref:glutamyl-tRNA reductase n=1 Tax=Moraxella marmotae TaxID=3344520 RepID=UPI0035D4E81B
MKLAVIGVNHKTAPVSLRERLSFGSDMPQAIEQMAALTSGCTIVSTCNRSELYVGLDDDELYADDALDEQTDAVGIISPKLRAIGEWLAEFKGVAFDEISPYLYAYEGSRALNHWLRVAAGLDSMILGEPQILGQIRQAVATAKEHGGISSEFGWLTQQVFAAARTVRRDTKVGAQAVTLGFATAKLATQIFDNPSELTFLLVAAGEMNRLVAHNVAALGVKKIIICNRTHERAKILGDELAQMQAQAGRAVEIELCGLGELARVLPEADIISSCSGSMQALIDVAMVKQALKVRRHQPMLFVDLAVPRDIEPLVEQLDNVYLYSVDDLQHVIAGNLAERKQAAVEAELLVGQLVADIEAQMQEQLAREHIQNYRQMAQARTDALLKQALDKIDDGADAKLILAQFAHDLSQTLMHSPSRLIRHSAKHSDAQMLEMVSYELIHSYRKPIG